MKRFTTRPSPSMAVAMLALFITLGGTGYAATHLSRNSVKSPQIAPNAVGSSEIRNGSVGRRDLSRAVRRQLDSANFRGQGAHKVRTLVDEEREDILSFFSSLGFESAGLRPFVKTL